MELVQWTIACVPMAIHFVVGKTDFLKVDIRQVTTFSIIIRVTLYEKRNIQRIIPHYIFRLKYFDYFVHRQSEPRHIVILACDIQIWIAFSQYWYVLRAVTNSLEIWLLMHRNMIFNAKMRTLITLEHLLIIALSSRILSHLGCSDREINGDLRNCYQKYDDSIDVVHVAN